ncbi:hypothetical protein [Brenneria tiliae]|uniref:hypothetical protein n=1 Tax=Brenneria tiliae TaxID=2914984 RepID=UPI002014D6BC|nr:hypothetical protein [Brenneria tiliae]MCL2897398.1 hypothetical protein [Brenneria tiliae]MCL2901659.1 hypothetical protein [Brenneria tiliae]
MKNFKFIAILSLLASTAPAFAETCFDGTWQGEVLGGDNGLPKSTFALTLSQIENNLTGRYCYVGKSGNKTDCSINADNIHGIVKSNNSAILHFYSDTHGEDGEIELSRDENEIEWRINSEPAGNRYYYPRTYSLEKASPKKEGFSVRRSLKTEDFTITIINYCGGFYKKCDDTSYIGIRNSDKKAIMLNGKTFTGNEDSVNGYEFKNKNIIYRISINDASIEIIQNSKTLKKQSGIWNDISQ